MSRKLIITGYDEPYRGLPIYIVESIAVLRGEDFDEQ
jgi:hypothetical protein